MPFKNCRGNETKQKLVDDYDIVPLSFLKLLPNQEKQGCCGVLKDKYYVFEYQNKQNIHEKGSFFVGYDCGEQFLNLLNIDKSKYKLFNPLSSMQSSLSLRSDRSSATTQRDELNQEVYNAINLICIAWNQPPKYGIQNILNFVRNPNNGRTHDWAIKEVNKLVSNDYHNRTLTQIVQELSVQYNIRNFSFELMNDVIESLKENEDIENYIE